MLPIDEILDMWKKDAVIDDNFLDDASLGTSRLHSKYLELLSLARLQLKKKDNEHNTLLKNKWLWYEGKLSKEEMDNLGWNYDPLNGLKVLKGNMYYYYNADKDIQDSLLRLEYHKTLISTLEEILQSIKWRHQSIKNAIDWKRFTSGA